MIAFVHYSPRRLRRIEDVAQCLDGSDKPDGLWLCPGEEWRDLVLEAGLSRTRLRRRYRVSVDPARLIVIETARALDAFTRAHRHRDDTRRSGCERIDWARVAGGHDGIVVAPYIWARRLSPLTRWYYGWDIASACIWRARSILAVEEEPVAFHRSGENGARASHLCPGEP